MGKAPLPKPPSKPGEYVPIDDKKLSKPNELSESMQAYMASLLGKQKKYINEQIKKEES